MAPRDARHYADLSSYFRRFSVTCSSLEFRWPIGTTKSALNRFIPHGAGVYSTDLQRPSRALRAPFYLIVSAKLPDCREVGILLRAKGLEATKNPPSFGCRAAALGRLLSPGIRASRARATALHRFTGSLRMGCCCGYAQTCDAGASLPAFPTPSLGSCQSGTAPLRWADGCSALREPVGARPFLIPIDSVC
jgi:hypothetical protein